MTVILIWFLVFAAGLAVLVKASDYFTRAAVSLGLTLGAPPFIIGVTIVSAGTSLPELVSSLFAVYEGSPGIVAGNVIGSNVANIFLIVGVAAVVGRTMEIEHRRLMLDLFFLLASALLFALCAWDGYFDRADAFLSLSAYLIYALYNISYRQGKIPPEKIIPIIEGEERKKSKPAEKAPYGLKVSLAILASSGVFVFLGAKYTVEAIIRLSSLLGVGSEIIAAGAVALGTSLPELAVSVAAARKGYAEIAMGNIIGSNIFNSFIVMGLPALAGELAVPAIMVSFGLPVMVIATILFIHLIQDREITSWEGWMLLLFYMFFLIRLLAEG